MRLVGFIDDQPRFLTSETSVSFNSQAKEFFVLLGWIHLRIHKNSPVFTDALSAMAKTARRHPSRRLGQSGSGPRKPGMIL